MSFENAADRNKAEETFSKSLLYFVYRIAEELGFADEGITATDAQKKNIVMDMYNSNVISLSGIEKALYTDNPTFEDIAHYIFDCYVEDSEKMGISHPSFDIGVRYNRRTEAIRVTIPSYPDVKDYPDQYYAFAYMPLKGFDTAKRGPHYNNKFPVQKETKKTESASISDTVKYSSGEIDKDTYSYFKRNLNRVFAELGEANQGITKDSQEFQELSVAVSRFNRRVKLAEQEGRFTVSTLKGLLDWKGNNNDEKSVMDCFNAYIDAKGREKGDLSSKQVSRLNACGRMQALYAKIDDIAWQEKNYYPKENEINKLGAEIKEQYETIRRYQSGVRTRERELNSEGVTEERKDALEAEISENKKVIDETTKNRANILTDLKERQEAFDKFVQANPDHRLNNGFLNSDRYKDAIAGKLLTARLQELEPSAMKKALTDKTVYADLFAKVKESREFRDKTASLSNDNLRKLSGKAPSDILKEFVPKKITLTVNDDKFIQNLEEANRDTGINNRDLYSVMDFLRVRSVSLLEELKKADSTFHSKSHKKFEASLENLNKKILSMGNSTAQMKNLSFNDLKGTLSDVAFAAQAYQCLHRGKTIANGGLNKKIIDRMAVAAEIGIIYDCIASPKNAGNVFRDMMDDVFAFQVARNSIGVWMKNTEDLTAYVKTGADAGNAKTADTFASDLTNHKTFMKREVQAVKNNTTYQKEIHKGQNAHHLRKILEESGGYALQNLNLGEKAADKSMALV